jgi:hypothetical protein
MRMNDLLPQKLYKKDKKESIESDPIFFWSNASKLIAKKNVIEFFSKSSSWFQILHSSIF